MELNSICKSFSGDGTEPDAAGAQRPTRVWAYNLISDQHWRLILVDKCEATVMRNDKWSLSIVISFSADICLNWM